MLTALATLQPGSLISYLIAVAVPALDAIFPVLPSETAVIALGVATAGSTDPRIALLVACAAIGAFAGDNLCYFLGSRFGPLIERRFFASAKGARRRAWAQRSLGRFGTQLIIVCRFIPGGRTAVTLSCGLLGYPRRRFIAATAAAGTLWACYAFFIGRLGGRALEGKPWAAFLLAAGIAVVVSGVIEAVRRIRSRRSRRGHSAPCPRRYRPLPPGSSRTGASRAGPVRARRYRSRTRSRPRRPGAAAGREGPGVPAGS
jgi:membrane protein DedA with SNARE-associated domain